MDGKNQFNDTNNKFKLNLMVATTITKTKADNIPKINELKDS